MAKKIATAVKKNAKRAETRVHEVKERIAAAKNPTTSKVYTNKLELLITIVPSPKAEFYTDLLVTYEVNCQFLTRAHGTANADMWSISDFTDQTKTVIFSVIKQERVQEALDMLDKKFATIKKGRGIAFTVPFSSVIGVATYGFLSNNTTIRENNKQ